MELQHGGSAARRTFVPCNHCHRHGQSCARTVTASAGGARNALQLQRRRSVSRRPCRRRSAAKCRRVPGRLRQQRVVECAGSDTTGRHTSEDARPNNARRQGCGVYRRQASAGCGPHRSTAASDIAERACAQPPHATDAAASAKWAVVARASRQRRGQCNVAALPGFAAMAAASASRSAPGCDRRTASDRHGYRPRAARPRRCRAGSRRGTQAR